MHPELQEALFALRAKRGFSAPSYLRAKTDLLNTYLRESGISACVVAVSGGVDSAVTLGLVRRAQDAPHSPIRRIVAALMPMFVEEGATNQEAALARGREVAEAFGVEHAIVDLTQSLTAVKSSVEKGSGIPGGAWAAGQLVSYLRTPALYYLATLLTQEGFPCIVCGTTNRDEGSYLGFFGKASDGMVDLQLISDLHKSEVFALAALLGVPESVLRATPTGDTFDGRTDEEMIGAPYDFVELYELYLASNEREKERLRAGLGREAAHQFETWSAQLEALHQKNLHKYLAGSPAIHLDVYERAVPGGWREEYPYAPSAQHPPKLLPLSRVGEEEPKSPFVGEFQLSPDLIARFERAPRTRVTTSPLLDFGESALLVDGLLRPEECTWLVEEVARQKRVPVGQNGMLKGFDPERDKIGSFRATAFNEALAKILWERLSEALPRVRMMKDDTPTDWNGHRVWRAIGLNPLLRFIWYEPGGLLIPHYDAGYDFGDGQRHTLMSLVLFLTDAEEGAGGATRFLLDPQRHLPLGERTYEDWPREAQPRDVLLPVQPRAGAALVFDHRVLHDGEIWRGPGNKILLRTDVIFTRCGLQAKRPAPPLPKAPPLWQRLGLPADAPPAEVDRACALALKDASIEETETLRFAWKFLRDPFYAGAYTRLGTREAVEEAGFFDDLGPPVPPDDPREAPEWLVTPLHKITARLAALEAKEKEGEAPRWLAVLLTTGAFCPVHPGHIEMMELAREALERRGAFVLGGYLSPSHDAYVSLKCGSQNPGAAHRLRLCQKATEESDWLMADGWEALCTDRALNFTDVIARLERYLSRHVRSHRPVRVVYVFGSDNARFALSFVARGYGLCVPRPGYEVEMQRIAAHPLVRENPRIFMAQEAAPDLSSSRVRKGEEASLPDGVRALWRAWHTRPDLPDEERPSTLLYLRDEGDWAISHWQAGRDAAALSRAREVFREKLKEALSRAFRDAKPPDVSRTLTIKLLALTEQRRPAARLTQKEQVISLDPCIDGDRNLGVSRCFALSVNAAEPGLVARPGWPSLEEQLSRIPPGEYVLLDDDIASGHTLKSVLALLPPTCIIKRVVHLCEVEQSSGEPWGAQIFDLCDCRDFLAGAREGGLVVALPDGTLARAPYLLPYVRPADRISVPLSCEEDFSHAVWRLNLEFFQSITPPIRVADAAPAFQTLALYLGFYESTPMEEVCLWHLERLRSTWETTGLRE